MESGILGFGIRYTANGIRNPSNDCNLDQNPSYTDKKNTVPGNRNPRGVIQNPSLSRISLHGVSCNKTSKNVFYTFSNLIRALPSTCRQINTPTFLNGKDPFHKESFNFFSLLFQLNFDITCINSEGLFFFIILGCVQTPPSPQKKMRRETLFPISIPIPRLSTSQRVLL